MISYEPLRELLTIRGCKLADLGLAPATTAKIRKDESTSLEVLDRICEQFSVSIEEIIVFIDKEGNRISYNSNRLEEELKEQVLNLRNVIAEKDREITRLAMELSRSLSDNDAGEPSTSRKFQIIELKQLRKQKNMTQEELAVKVGLTKQYVSICERSNHVFTEQLFKKFNEALTIPEENIVEITK